jgi:malonate transporter
MDIGVLLNGFLPVFGIMMLGFYLKSRVLKDDSQWIPIEKVTFLILMPSFIIVALASADMTSLAIWPFVLTLLCALAITFVILALLYPSLTRKNKQKIAAYTSLFQTSTRFNGFIALALVASLYGENATAIVALGLITMIPPINVVNITVMTWLLTDKQIAPGQILLKILKNPLIIGCLLGIAINLSGLSLWQPVHEGLTILGRASLGITLLTVGAGLTLGNLEAMRLKLLLACFFKLVFMPALVLVIALLQGINGLELNVLMILAAMPTAANGYLLAREMGGDAPLYANASSLQVILSLIAIPFWLEFAQRVTA